MSKKSATLDRRSIIRVVMKALAKNFQFDHLDENINNIANRQVKIERQNKRNNVIEFGLKIIEQMNQSGHIATGFFRGSDKGETIITEAIGKLARGECSCGGKCHCGGKCDGSGCGNCGGGSSGNSSGGCGSGGCGGCGGKKP